MTVLTIRKHKRFAVCRSVRLRKDSRKGAEALLIELSLEGCRLGMVDHRKFAVGEHACVRVDGFEPIEGQVRWSHDGCVGLRFTRGMHIATLDRLIAACRAPAAVAAPLLAVGA